MYCTACGNSINANLNYCSGCGTPLPAAMAAPPAAADNSPSSAVYVSIAGIIGFIIVLRMMLRSDVPEKALIMITLFYMTALFGICLAMIRHGSMFGKRSKEQTGGIPDPAYLRPATTAQLHAPRGDSIPSVTDNTTRALDEVYVKRPGV